MKYLVPAIVVLGLAGLFTACGGEDDKDEPSTLEKCKISCEQSAECYPASGSSSSSFDVAGCRDSCREAIDEVDARGCTDQYDSLLTCSMENSSCSLASGSGDNPCDAQISKFSRCYGRSGGSGS